MWQERLNEFVTLFIVVNPIAALPVFLAVAGGFDAAAQRRVAIVAVLVSLAVLLFFMVCGGFLLEKMGISLRSFQVAGGIILFLVALDMVRGTLHVILLLAARPISRVIGPSGASVISRVMGMILVALAVHTVLSALAAWLNLPKP